MLKQIFSCFLIIWSSWAIAHDVVIQRNSNLRLEPNTASSIIKLLMPGDEAKLLDTEKSDGYYRVLHREGIGWLWSNNLKVYPEYNRKDWKHWIDEDIDCQKTRDEVLIAESEVAVVLDADGCKVISGQWTAPYTGVVYTDPKELDVDHMVPLKNAHRSGGWEWDYSKRKDYANDMDNPQHLIAVSASANRSKGWKGPELWKPLLESYWCQYATDWEVIKQQWELEISEPERSAINEMKATCQ